MAISIRRLAARLQGSRFLLAALLAGISWGTVADAAPVTFRFDATVTHALAANPFDLPFGYQVGGEISGKLTFEPGSGEPLGDTATAIEAEQFLDLEFSIDGVEFGSSRYSIRVVNDTLIDDSGINGLVDTMNIRCSPSAPQSCMPDLISLPGGDPFSIGSRIQLTGIGSILEMPSISPDSEIWNLFAFNRSLSLSFRDQSNGSISLFATIGAFEPVPEPATFCLVKALILCFAVGSRRRRKRIAQRR